MSATQKSDDEKPVVIDGTFVRAAVTNAVSQFFRPLTVVFERTDPSTFVVRKVKRPDDQDRR